MSEQVGYGRTNDQKSGIQKLAHGSHRSPPLPESHAKCDCLKDKDPTILDMAAKSRVKTKVANKDPRGFVDSMAGFISRVMSGLSRNYLDKRNRGLI